MTTGCGLLPYAKEGTDENNLLKAGLNTLHSMIDEGNQRGKAVNEEVKNLREFASDAREKIRILLDDNLEAGEKIKKLEDLNSNLSSKITDTREDLRAAKKVADEGLVMAKSEQDRNDNIEKENTARDKEDESRDTEQRATLLGLLATIVMTALAKFSGDKQQKKDRSDLEALLQMERQKTEKENELIHTRISNRKNDLKEVEKMIQNLKSVTP